MSHRTSLQDKKKVRGAGAKIETSNGVREGNLVPVIELLKQMGFLAPSQRARGAAQRERYGGNIKKTDVFLMETKVCITLVIMHNANTAFC